VYSQDELNIVTQTGNPPLPADLVEAGVNHGLTTPVHRYRVWPLKDRAGNPVANSYLIALEEATNDDYQDMSLHAEQRAAGSVNSARDGFHDRRPRRVRDGASGQRVARCRARRCLHPLDAGIGVIQVDVLVAFRRAAERPRPC